MPDEHTMELAVVLKVSGDTRALLAGMPGDKVRALIGSSLVEAIQKAVEEHDDPPTRETTWKRAILAKTEGETEERYVLGIVMEPDETDTQGHTETVEEIRKACHNFMEAYRSGGKAGHMGLMHNKVVDGQIAILENYIQKSDETIGTELVKAGSWLMAVRVISDAIWKSVKAGDLTGFSIGGTAVVQELPA